MTQLNEPGHGPALADSQTVDLVVIGTGPGGEALALEAAKAGLEVVAIEKHLVGGECPYYGCIPSKMMLRAAETLAEAKRAQLMAGHIDVTPQWAPVAHRISEKATSGWSDAIAVERLEQAGATVIHGSGRVTGPHGVRVDRPDGQTAHFTARTGMVLNPGTRPAIPPIAGLADTPYWTNRQAVQTSELPHSLIILGGGSVAVELGQVFARFGVAVTIIERGPRLLHDDEPEASEAIIDALRTDGIRILTDAETAMVRHDTGFTLTLADGSQIEAEQLMVATGRVPNLEELGLETVGISPAAITIGDDLRIGDRLWMIGDVTGMGAFTHVSMHQSAVVRRQILGEPALPPAFHSVPHVTFTDPEVGSVGLTEHVARASGIRLATRTADLGSRGATHGPAAAGGFVKLVVDTDREVLVGATVVGPAAGEVLSMLTLAVHAQIPIETLQSMIYAYPTFHRAVGAAVAQL